MVVAGMHWAVLGLGLVAEPVLSVGGRGTELVVLVAGSGRRAIIPTCQVCMCSEGS
jgi:hypothetical protein